MKTYDSIILGGGSAGLSAAVELKKNGIDNILVLERDVELGGVLLQCIHNGFGLKVFNEELSGPEYAERYVEELMELGIEVKLNTIVTSLSDDRVVEYSNVEEGFQKVQGKTIILTMGCYERSGGAISLPGNRPSGVLTAGTAQKYLNMDGYLVGKKVFILGSGDIGLIMARRMTLEGAEVVGVAEILPYSSGLQRNIVQCLDDFNIPLFLSHTITNIEGKERIEKLTISEVDGFTPIPGTEKDFEVDTLLLSVGLIPENGLSEEAGVILHHRTKGPIVNESYQTNIEGIFACGNVLHVHDLVDFVSIESEKAGKAAAKYIKKPFSNEGDCFEALPGNGISYIVPHKVSAERLDDNLELFMRPTGVFKNAKLIVKADGEVIKTLNKKHLAPAEMEIVKIKKELLLNIEKELTVEVEVAK